METYNGHVRTPQDAIILFEACRIGQLPRVQRRLSEKERQQIKSGSVFVWDEREAGMRRWTDGKSWSASRVSGSFLTYREMEGKRGTGFAPPPQAPRKSGSKAPSGTGSNDSDGDEGPDGYRYKPDGLMKQSFSITTQTGQHLHLISYYARSSPGAQELMQPSNDPALRHIRPQKGMYPESTVNEASSVPAVTRSPMQGSPYAPSPHQMAIGSPYARSGPQHPTGYIAVAPQPTQGHGWPPTPLGTPPYGYYYPTGAHIPPPGHSPMQYGHVTYAPPPHFQYGAPVPPPTRFDQPPAPLSNSNGLPPPPPQQNGPPPQYAHHQHQPQYIANPSPRAQAPPINPNHHPPTNSKGPLIDPRLATGSSNGEHSQGPQLPQLNGDRRDSPRPTSSGAPATKPDGSNNLAIPEVNGSTNGNNAPSPASKIPTISALMNNAPTEHSTDNKSEKSVSRAGSKSPNSLMQRTAGELNKSKADLHEDDRVLRRLDRVFVK